MPGPQTSLAPSQPRKAIAAVVLFVFTLSSAHLAGVAVGVPIENPFSPGETRVVAEFERAVGLYPQSRVVADGVEVGEVTDIEILSDRVRVELELHDIAIAADTKAVLRLRSLIGERYVELDSVWAGEGQRLEGGDVIGLDRTVIPAEITEFLDEAARVSDELDGAALGRVVDELAVVLADEGRAVATLLTELDAAGAVVAERADEIDATLVALDRAIATLAEEDQTIASVLRNGTTVSQALLAQQGALDAAITGIDTLVGELATFTRDQREGLTDVTSDLDTIGGLLASHRADFEQVVHYLPLASYGFARAISRDGDRWFLQPQVTGTLVQPFTPNLNSRGGLGSENDDNRFVPAVDFEDSVAREIVPRDIDTTPILGAGPLLPSGSIGPITIDAEGSGR